jgi:hypothetical protein
MKTSQNIARIFFGPRDNSYYFLDDHRCADILQVSKQNEILILRFIVEAGEMTVFQMERNKTPDRNGFST